MPDAQLTLIDAPSAPLGTPPGLSDADPRAGHVGVTDLGVNRGDGVFEVAGCLHGRIHALVAHLARLARSADMLDLPAPNLDHFAAAAHRSVDALTARHSDAELLCKLVYTRGPEIGSGQPLAWALAYPSPDFSAERTAGIDVITLDRGVASTVTATSPWLLAGAKTLSYATNKAALREANRRGRPTCSS